MAQESNVAAVTENAWMFFQSLAIRHGVEIGIENGLAVHHNLDLSAVGGDLLRVPFPRLFQCAFPGGNDVVNRAMKLGIMERAPFSGQRRAFFQDLDFHAQGRSAALQGRTDAHSVIRALLQLKLEPENEIRVFLLRVKIASTTPRAVDNPVFNTVTVPAFTDQRPAFQGFAIEQAGKPGVVCCGSRDGQKVARQQQGHQ